MFTRNGYDWTDRYGPIAGELADGEDDPNRLALGDHLADRRVHGVRHDVNSLGSIGEFLTDMDFWPAGSRTISYLRESSPPERAGRVPPALFFRSIRGKIPQGAVKRLRWGYDLDR
jgi:hypothetical protein